jgi:hypothetical protein
MACIESKDTVKKLFTEYLEKKDTEKPLKDMPSLKRSIPMRAILI